MDTAEVLLRIRLGQMMVNEKYKNGDFKVPIHLALGHEAIAVAVDSVMTEDDKLILDHRNIHYNIAREKKLKPEIDEYMLRDTGLAGGQLGSMNLANEAKGIAYTSSILGNNMPVAAGIALGAKVKVTEAVTIVVTGDGAMEEGTFYESLVFAKSNDLPMIFIIENNQWSLATTIEQRRCAIDVEKLTESLGIAYEKLTSNDVYDYVDTLEILRQHALSNKEPICVEVVVTTLGDWRLKSEEYPDGKFINYHAGPAPTVKLDEGPLIRQSEQDPIFVMQNRVGKEELNRMTDEILAGLQEECL